ncbi:NAD(P)-binding protein [Delitschia confertaspora ATCC 74209]|uniref:NAD(P)-binding protein n=1 Tax=Delitschia confertaspora ATCC 74209 TaxID=1513339 RepID=A0A9P4JGG5_9PLEO|nr:NAD(P)-binding protein [Delitschia confertaspora ATCC 74209]
MRTVLVTGASGLLGRQVLKTFQLDGFNAVGTALNRVSPPSIVKLDILDTEAIENVLNDVKPDVVVHCVANRFPDSCSADPEAAHKLNAAATKALASATFSRDIFLIYISTDYVFSGRPGEAPYKVDSATDPPNVYGQTKREGEKAVLDVTRKSGNRVLGVVLRIPILYGPCDEPSESAVNSLMTHVWESQNIKQPTSKIKVDDYAQRYPTNTEDVARVCRDISALYFRDQASNYSLPPILQFSSEDKMTKWGICKVFSEILGLPLDGMEPHKPAENDKAAVKRPYDCHLDTSTLRELGVNLQTTDFKTWWRMETRAFRH